MSDAVIVAAARTPIGTARKGTLLDVTTFELAAHAAGEALKRSGIPAADVEKHREKQPQAQLFVYEHTGHAFNRDVDPKVYNEAAAKTAWRRTLDFLETQLR